LGGKGEEQAHSICLNPGQRSDSKKVDGGVKNEVGQLGVYFSREKEDRGGVKGSVK